MTMRMAMRQSRTLKDKRRVVRSLKDQIRRKFNVSVAEVGRQDNHQHAVIGIAIVSGSSQFANTVLNKVIDFIRRFHHIELVDYEIEML